MLRHISYPVNAGGTEESVGIETTGDDTRNLALFQFVNQLNLTVNLCNRRINLPTLLVQPCRYRFLLRKRRNNYLLLINLLCRKLTHCCTVTEKFHDTINEVGKILAA